MRSLAIYMIILSLVTTDLSAAATAAGRITMNVVRTLAIAETKPMSFANDTPGATEATVDPEGTHSGQFQIQGEAHLTYTIQLPAQVTLTTGAGAEADEKIQVSQFTSSPANTGTLDSNGEQVLLVGATRAALRQNQAIGTYNGEYPITIIY